MGETKTWNSYKTSNQRSRQRLATPAPAGKNPPPTTTSRCHSTDWSSEASHARLCACYAPTALVHRSNDMITYQFSFVLHWCSPTSEISYWINWEERNRLVCYSLLFSSQWLPSTYHIDRFISLNKLHPSKAQCVEWSHNLFHCCVNFLLSNVTLTFLFTKQALFVNMSERFQIYLPCT